jgi:hypothetical protein
MPANTNNESQKYHSEETAEMSNMGHSLFPPKTKFSSLIITNERKVCQKEHGQRRQEQNDFTKDSHFFSLHSFSLTRLSPESDRAGQRLS